MESFERSHSDPIEKQKIFSYLIDPESIAKVVLYWAAIFICGYTVTSLAVTEPDYGVDISGSLSGAASVSPYGDARFQIPIVVPPGINGMQPDVALNYNSIQKQGSAGAGWLLSAGQQSISRCASTVAQDGISKGVNYTTQDRLCLNGERLVKTSMPTAAYGISGSEYRTEVLSLRKIEAIGAAGTAPEAFKVTEPNGMVYQFGKVSQALDGRFFAAQGASTTRSWALSRVSDTSGNYMDYHYVSVAAGEYYLDRIDYTSTATAAGQFQVKLNYEDRVNDTWIVYEAGSSITVSQRLSSVETRFNAVPVRKYHLDYEAGNTGSTAVNRLAFVTECAFDGSTQECKEPLKIEWTDHTEGWYPGVNLPSAVGGDRFMVGDWDGDGRDDLFMAVETSANGEYRATWKFSLGKDSLSTVPIETGINAHEFETVGEKAFSYHLIDANGDGRQDLLQAKSGDGVGNWLVYLSTGDSSAPFTDGFDTGISQSVEFTVPRVVDYDNDGLEDVIYAPGAYYGGGLLLFKNTGVFSASDTSFDSAVVSLQETLVPFPGTADGLARMNLDTLCCEVDLNADGVQDFRVRVEWEYETQCQGGDGFPDTCDRFWYGPAYIVSTGTGYEYQAIDSGTYDTPYPLSLGDYIHADVNGDGLTDLVSEDQLKLYLNNGKKFDLDVFTSIPAIPDEDGGVGRPIIADYNLDGRQDLIWRSENGNLWVRMSTGDNFSDPVNRGVVGSYLFAADIDGDGFVDLLEEVKGAQETSPASLFDPCSLHDPDECDWESEPGLGVDPTPLPTVRRRTHKSAYGDVVERITDGYDNYYEFNYESIATSTHYSQLYPSLGISGQYTYLKNANYKPYWGGSHVVSSLVMSDGIGGEYSSNYYYESAMSESTGRGFLGFRAVTQIDSRTGVKTKTTHHLEYPLTGAAETVEVMQADGTIIEKVENEWNISLVEADTPNRLFTYLDLSVETFYELDLDSEPPNLNGQEYRKLTTDYHYDLQSQYRRLTAIYRDPIPAEGYALVGTLYHPANYDGSNWCFTLNNSVTEVAQWTSDIQSHKTSFEPNGAKCRYDSETRFANKSAEFQSVFTYTYDGFGNRASNTHSAPSGAVFANNKTFKPRRKKILFSQSGQYPLHIIDCFDDADINSCSQTDPDNPSVTQTWIEEIGQIDTSTDSIGNMTDFHYDSFGRLTKMILPNGDGRIRTVNYVHDDCESSACWPSTAVRRVDQQEVGGAHSTVYYDALSRMVGRDVHNLTGVIRESIEYNDRGLVAKQYKPTYAPSQTTDRWTQFEYDPMGRVIEQAAYKDNGSILFQQIKTVYSGLETVTLGPDGPDPGQGLFYETKVLRDGFGRIMRSTGKDGHYVEFKYTPLGYLKKTINSSDGSIIINTIDARGRISVKDDPSLGVRSYHYDVADNLVKSSDAKGQVTLYEYDSLGRLYNRDDNGIPSLFRYFNDKFSDNGFGKLVGYARGEGAEFTDIGNYFSLGAENSGTYLKFSYDDVGRVITEFQNIGLFNLGVYGGSFYVTDRTYNDIGKLETLTYPQHFIPTSTVVDRFSIRHEYEHGMLKRIIDDSHSTGPLYSVTSYNEWNKPSSWTLGNESQNEVTASISTHTMEPWVTGTSSQNTNGPLTARSALRDNIGNVDSQSDDLRAMTLNHSYDSISRLYGDEADHCTPLNCPSGMTRFSDNGNLNYKLLNGHFELDTSYPEYGYFEYDQTTGGGPHAVSKVTSPNKPDRVYQYDLNGNMINRKGHAITWTSFDKPIRIYDSTGFTEFDYDALHQRYVKKEATTLLAYVGKIFEHYVGNQEELYRHYIYAGDKMVAVRNFGERYDDDDGDTIDDTTDNCTLKSNADQRDTDSDGYGNKCDPDLNNDLVVNFLDLAIFSNHFASEKDGEGDYSEHADFNGDDFVNNLDLAVFPEFFTANQPGPSNLPIDSHDTFYLHTNHQGTIETITDRMGELVHERYFNEYGQYRRTDDWQLPAESELGDLPQAGTFYITNRGFTGHEHLLASGLIHMNGRLYDPEIGRMISADPFIPDPMDAQSYNRYSYVRNNPVTRIDPTGYMDECNTGSFSCTTTTAPRYRSLQNARDFGYRFDRLQRYRSVDPWTYSGGSRRRPARAVSTLLNPHRGAVNAARLVPRVSLWGISGGIGFTGGKTGFTRRAAGGLSFTIALDKEGNWIVVVTPEVGVGLAPKAGVNGFVRGVIGIDEARTSSLELLGASDTASIGAVSLSVTKPLFVGSIDQRQAVYEVGGNFGSSGVSATTGVGFSFGGDHLGRLGGWIGRRIYEARYD